MQVILLFESVCVVGERGQITLPKTIRKIKGILGKDKVIVKLKGEEIVVEKMKTKKNSSALFKEYYQKYGKRDLAVCKDWELVDKETDAMLDDY